jgi:ABC-2 type transport system permease protein
VSRLLTLPRAVGGELRRILWRQRDVLLVLVAIPVLYPLVVSGLYERVAAVERPLLVVDLDNSALSRRLTLALDATPELALRGRVDDVAEGRRALRSGEAEVLVRLPPDLSRRVARGEPASVKLWIEAANMLTYGVAYPGVRAALAAVNDELSADQLRRRGLTTALATRRVPPIGQESRLLYHPTGSYGGFLILGVLLLVVQQMVLIALSFSLGRRREPGGRDPLFERAPFTTAFGAFLAQSVFYLAGTAFVLLVVAPTFGWPIQRPASMFALFAAFIAALAPLAVLIGVAVRDGVTGFQVLMFVTIPMLMTSGYAWPADQMPAYVRALAALFPATPALQAVRVLATKTGELSAVLPQLRWLGLQAAAYGALTLGVAGVSWWRRARARRSPANGAGLADADAV